MTAPTRAMPDRSGPCHSTTWSPPHPQVARASKNRGRGSRPRGPVSRAACGRRAREATLQRPAPAAAESGSVASRLGSRSKIAPDSNGVTRSGERQLPPDRPGSSRSARQLPRWQTAHGPEQLVSRAAENQGLARTCREQRSRPAEPFHRDLISGDIERCFGDAVRESSPRSPPPRSSHRLAVRAHTRLGGRGPGPS